MGGKMEKPEITQRLKFFDKWGLLVPAQHTRTFETELWDVCNTHEKAGFARGVLYATTELAKAKTNEVLPMERNLKHSMKRCQSTHSNEQCKWQEGHLNPHQNDVGIVWNHE